MGMLCERATALRVSNDLKGGRRVRNEGKLKGGMTDMVYGLSSFDMTFASVFSPPDLRDFSVAVRFAVGRAARAVW